MPPTTPDDRLSGTHVLLIGSGDLGRAVLSDLIASGIGEVTVTTQPGSADPVLPAFEPGKTFDLLLDADLVVEASGDATTRYLANDAAAIRGIAMVWGEVGERSGRVGVAWDERGVDYRDVDPVPESAVTLPGRADPDAVAVIARAIVAESIGVLTGNARPGLVVSYDVATGIGRESRHHRDRQAPRPGSLEERTAMTEERPNRSTTAAELAAELEGPDAPLLVDVRQPWEAELVSIPGSTLIPLGELPTRLGELDPAAPVVLYCHHGVRSDRALAVLEGAGFTRARHLTGGIEAWATEVDPSLPRY